MCYEQNYRNKLILKNKVYHVIVVLRFFSPIVTLRSFS